MFKQVEDLPGRECSVCAVAQPATRSPEVGAGGCRVGSCQRDVFLLAAQLRCAGETRVFSRQRWPPARGRELLLSPRQQRHCDPSLCTAPSSGCTRIPGVCCCWHCLLEGAWAGVKLPRTQSPPETRQLPRGLSLREPWCVCCETPHCSCQILQMLEDPPLAKPQVSARALSAVPLPTIPSHRLVPRHTEHRPDRQLLVLQPQACVRRRCPTTAPSPPAAAELLRNAWESLAPDLYVLRLLLSVWKGSVLAARLGPR